MLLQMRLFHSIYRYVIFHCVYKPWWWWFSHSVMFDSWHPKGCSPPGSSVHGLLQAKTMEWVTISFSRGSCWPRDWTRVSCIAGKFFTNWATREDLYHLHLSLDKTFRLLLCLAYWKQCCYKHCKGFPRISGSKESGCDAGDYSSIPGLGKSTRKGMGYAFRSFWAPLVAQLVKNPPAMWETWVQSLGWENPLEEGMAIHSSLLAWRIPWSV